MRREKKCEDYTNLSIPKLKENQIPIYGFLQRARKKELQVEQSEKTKTLQ